MQLEKGDFSLMHTQTFPDAVTEHETAIKYRYPGLIARELFAIDID